MDQPERDEAPGLGAGTTEPQGDAILGAALEGLRRAAEEVEVERSVAETLQRSLLRERLPDVAGLRLAAHYQPGSSEARIGGDWYDAIPLRDGRLALAMGDVVGRGVEAAARMAHLQSAVRAYALEGLRPALVLDRMNSFAHELEGGGTATLLLAVIDAEAESMRVASAGHPPPVVVRAGGEATLAEGPSGNPLGAFGLPAYEESVIPLAAGSTVVLYTDGLVESPERPLDQGLAALCAASAKLPEDPEEACTHLLHELLGGPVASDDVAMLVIRVEAPPQTLSLTIPADPRSLAGVRRALGRWLRAAGVSDGDAFEILVACGEAASNAIAHAYPPGEAHFTLRSHFEDGEAVIEVGDFGRWRAPRDGSSGRGLTLMEELTDHLDIERGKSGTLVTMRRRIGGRSA